MDRRALLIGSQTHGLRGVHDDVASMRDALAGFGFQARTLVGEQAGYDGIVDAYRALIADTADGDAVVVYYSGHGARYRNPLAARDPDSPAWLQYLVPTDLPGAAAGTFRGVLAEELSLLQSALTARTGNVTTILDCCHAARMSRNPLLRPRSPARPGAFPWAAVRGAWERLRADAPPAVHARPGAHILRGVRGDSNPLAVRLVACAPDETAYELPETASRRPQGVLTATLTRLLREPGSERLTWRQLIELLRPAVMDLVPTQRPEVAGPVDRYLFQAAERSASGVLAVRIRDGVAFLEHAALFAIGAGDRFALTAPGGAPDAPVATATVDLVSAGRARLALDTDPAALPAGAEAHPVGGASGWLAAAVVPSGHPQAARVADAVRHRAHLRIAAPGEAVVGTVRLTGDGAQLLDAQGEPLHAGPRPLTDAALGRLTADLGRLARATHLRDLDTGTGEAALDEPADVRYILLNGGTEQPLERSGAHLFTGDQVVVRVHNPGTARRYATVFDVGLRGAVTQLTTSEPSGVGIGPGDTYELYRLPGSNALAGMELFWPPDLPAGPPRPETVVTVVTDAPQDLTGLVQRGTATGGGTWTAGPAVRYQIERCTFYLHPGPRPAEAPPFDLDERPHPSFRLVPPEPAGPVPRRVTVRLTELAAHAGRPVRVDALVAAGPTRCKATTVRAGGDHLLFDGPVEGLLELAIWVTEGGEGEPDLADLLATAPAGGDPFARAAAVLPDGACGAYRTWFLPDDRFGAGDPVRRHPAGGLLHTGRISFAYEVTDTGR